MSQTRNRKAVFLATMDCAGYTWTVVGASTAEAKKAMVDYFRDYFKDSITQTGYYQSHGRTVTAKKLNDYFGLNITEMTPGKVEWR